jgi:hypothetical protein
VSHPGVSYLHQLLLHQSRFLRRRTQPSNGRSQSPKQPCKAGVGRPICLLLCRLLTTRRPIAATRCCQARQRRGCGSFWRPLMTS